MKLLLFLFIVFSFYACIKPDDDYVKRTDYVVIDSVRTDQLNYRYFSSLKIDTLEISPKAISIDINNDNIKDISFISSFTTSLTQNIAQIKVKTLNSNTRIALINTESFPKTFEYNNLIDEKENWKNGEFLMSYYERSTTTGFKDSLHGTWNNKLNKYIGISFTKDSIPLYGWLKVNVTKHNLISIKETALQRP